MCLLDYGCPCDYFTFDDDVLVRHVDETTMKERKGLLEWLKNQELPMKKAGAIFFKLWQDVVDYVKSNEFSTRLNYLCTINLVRQINNLQIESDMKNESVVHICLGDDMHYYFGSVAAIFDKFTPDELGVSLPTLWNYGLAPDRPYKNNRCAIYRGNINRKKHK